MFADSFCDSGWSNGSRRGWTTLLSFALQSLAVGGLLLLPLVYTQGLPKLARLVPVLAPAPPSAPQPAPPHPNSPAAQSNMLGIKLLSPSQIPPVVNMLAETAPPPPMVEATGFGVSHGTGDAQGNVLGSIPGSDLVMPPPPPAIHHPPVSRMMEGNLVLRVQPDYPALARQVRVQGTGGTASGDQSRRHDREAASA